MMAFAAHYIKQPLSNYYLDYRVLCEANFAVLDEFDLDIVQAISDPYRETSDFGADILFPKDGLPISRKPLLAEIEDFVHLPSPKPADGPRMLDRLYAIDLMRSQVGGKVPIMGWVEGALAQAAALRGMGDLLLDVYDIPTWVQDVLEHCVIVEIDFAEAQITAGADIVGIGDAVASQISPRMYRKLALPFEKRIIDAIHKKGALARLHICGDTTHILSDMALSGADIIDIDWMVDMGHSASVFGAGPAVCGNFDPVSVMLQGAPETVYDATLLCMKMGGDRCFSAAGCEIPGNTPYANLKAQNAALRSVGTAAAT
jgi:uroporphyrinogen decarboxylase